MLTNDHFVFFQASARVRILSSGRYLQINLAELDDRAQYTCVASNIAGKTTRQFNLAVNGNVMYLSTTNVHLMSRCIFSHIFFPLISCNTEFITW